MNDDTRIRDNALHVDEMVLGMFRGSHKKVLNVIVCPSKAKERIRGEQRMIRRLGELTNCLQKCQRIRVGILTLLP